MHSLAIYLIGLSSLGSPALNAFLERCLTVESCLFQATPPWSLHCGLLTALEFTVVGTVKAIMWDAACGSSAVDQVLDVAEFSLG